MRREEIIELVNGTADAAFVLDRNGVVAAWNKPAEKLFGIGSETAVGNQCSDVLHGVDECGQVCTVDCAVKLHAIRHEPMSTYDIQADTGKGKVWFSMTVMMAERGGTADGYTLHIARSADLKKRFEHLLRDFVVKETSLADTALGPMISVKNSVTHLTDLSSREIEVLKLLALGESTKKIADKLFISPTTVNNHVQSILKKLSAHTRLEAVRRAEKAGII